MIFAKKRIKGLRLGQVSDVNYLGRLASINLAGFGREKMGQVTCTVKLPKQTERGVFLHPQCQMMLGFAGD